MTDMSANRPYLMRAIYEWISDNGLTPYLLVDASVAGVRVPASTIKEGRVVLNIAARAVAQLDIGQDQVVFMARFSGASQMIEIPMAAVLALYAQENGQGMMFPADESAGPEPEPPSPSAPDEAPKRPHLQLVK